MLAELDSTLLLCRSLSPGDYVERSRFLEYRDRIHALLAHPDSGGQRAALQHCERERLVNFAALTDVAELADMLPFLQSVDPKSIRGKLLHVLQGPLMPEDESQNSNQARNILFELNLACKPWKAGVVPRLGEHPDVAIQLE